MIGFRCKGALHFRLRPTPPSETAMSALSTSAETALAAPAIAPHIPKATESPAYPLHDNRAG